MPLDERFAYCLFALAFVIYKARVEIVVSCFQECIYHLIELIIIKICRIAVKHRQSHHSKTKVFHSTFLTFFCA